MQKYSWTLALLLVADASARIVSNDYWQNKHTFATGFNVKIEAGKSQGSNAVMEQFAQSGKTLAGHPESVDGLTNVERVKSNFPLNDWNTWTNSADAIYTYDAFLRAVAKFPAFCGETFNDRTKDSQCKTEIAAFFAHASIGTDGLSKVEEPGCGAKDYCERGPLSISGKKMYSDFSEAFYEGNSKVLEDEPSKAVEDGYVAFASGMWRYMTHFLPAPSMHNVILGEWYAPNTSDMQAGHKLGFGTTTLIADKTLCGSGAITQGSRERAAKFNEFQGDLNQTSFYEDDQTCESMWTDFTWTGYANSKRAWFDQDWAGGNKCKSVSWETPYSANVADGYKSCVCEKWLGVENENCQQEAGSDKEPTPSPPAPSPSPEPSPSPGPEPDESDNPLQQLLKMISEIKDRPHYSDEQQSRTTWQIDETLDYVEEQLFLIETAFRQHGLMQ